jgi:hypothetical protein
MLYELRVYEALPGKLPALNARFQNHALKFFAKHGIKVLGFWTTAVGASSNALTYITIFENMAEREQRWTAFATDPEWLAIKRETDKDGPLTGSIRNEFLTPTTYSPLQ